MSHVELGNAIMNDIWGLKPGKLILELSEYIISFEADRKKCKAGSVGKIFTLYLKEKKSKIL